MVVYEQHDEETDLLFHALADRTRRDIVRRTLAEDLSVSSLADSYAMSFAAVQKHVAVLERAGLVSKTRRGREQLVRGEAETLRATTRLLDVYERIWQERVARIDDLLREDGAGRRRSTDQHDTTR